jgi:hypothetical protein
MSEHTNKVTIGSQVRGYNHVRYDGTADLSTTREEIVKAAAQAEWGVDDPPFGYREVIKTGEYFSIILHTN